MASLIRDFKPGLEYILKVAKKIDTGELDNEMRDTVYKFFNALRPLSHKFKEVCDVELYSYSYVLGVGEWFRIKDYYHQKYGSFLGSYDLLYVVREYGDLIKPHVRRPVREAFSELVDLAKELIPYEEIVFKINVPEVEVYFPVVVNGEVKLEQETVYKIEMSTVHPKELMLHVKGREWPRRAWLELSELPTLEDIMDYVVELYRRADAELSEVIEHNNRVLKRMKKVVMPYMISGSL